jgi:predicted transcriptional regulator
MKRTTVYLDESTDLGLARLAKQRGRAKAELVREALQTYLRDAEKAVDTVPAWVGMGRSGMPDLAERTDELLGEIYEERHARIMAEWEEYQKEPRE